MSGARFVRFYPSDWRSGCLGLTLEQSGLYVLICAHYWETAQRLPLDDAAAARRLGLNCKNYRKARDQLLNLGKIQKHENGYGNERAERELAAAQRAAKADEKVPMDSARGFVHREHEDGRDPAQGRDTGADTISQSIADSSTDQSPIHPPINGEKDEQNQCPSIEPYPEPEKERTTQRCVEGRAKAQWEIVSQACMEALGAAADPMAFGLMAVAEPQAWIAEGASLELDIVPAIRAAAARQIAKGLTVSGWGYFAKPVAQLKANRLAGLPAVKAELAKPAFKMGRYGLVRVVEAVQ